MEVDSKVVGRSHSWLKILSGALLVLGVTASPISGVFVFYANSRINTLAYARTTPNFDELVSLRDSLLYGTVASLIFLSASAVGLFLGWGPSRRRLLYALIGVHIAVGGFVGSILAANTFALTPAFLGHPAVASEGEVLVNMRSALIRGTATPSYVEVIIGINNTVRWRNDPSSLHPEVLVFSWEPVYRTHLLQQGQTWAYAFEKPGTYHYYSVIHRGVEGTIVVKQQNQTKP